MKYTRGDSVVAFEKLWFLQKRHAARYASSPVESALDQKRTHPLYELAVKPIFTLLDETSTSLDYSFYQRIAKPENRENFVQRLVLADAQNYTNPTEFIQRNIYFFTFPSVEALTATVPALSLHRIPSRYPNTVSRDIITSFFKMLMTIDPDSWGGDTIKPYLQSLISSGVKYTLENLEGEIGSGEEAAASHTDLQKSWVKLMNQYLRWALVAGKPGPDSVLTMELLGYEETGRRLGAAAKVLNTLKGRE
jgi:glutamyl-tRNA synthetase